MKNEILEDIELLASYWLGGSRISMSKRGKRCEEAAKRVEAWLATYQDDEPVV